MSIHFQKWNNLHLNDRTMSPISSATAAFVWLYWSIYNLCAGNGSTGSASWAGTTGCGSSSSIGPISNSTNSGSSGGRFIGSGILVAQWSVLVAQWSVLADQRLVLVAQRSVLDVRQSLALPHLRVGVVDRFLGWRTDYCGAFLPTELHLKTTTTNISFVNGNSIKHRTLNYMAEFQNSYLFTFFEHKELL